MQHQSENNTRYRNEFNKNHPLTLTPKQKFNNLDEWEHIIKLQAETQDHDVSCWEN